MKSSTSASTPTVSAVVLNMPTGCTNSGGASDLSSWFCERISDALPMVARREWLYCGMRILFSGCGCAIRKIVSRIDSKVIELRSIIEKVHLPPRLFLVALLITLAALVHVDLIRFESPPPPPPPAASDAFLKPSSCAQLKS